jgi:uncharacterized OsmC-like protein
VGGASGGVVEERQLTVSLEQTQGFEFLVRFDSGTELLMDEPEPLGGNKGPNATRVLSAAIGNCLSASLLFCLQKARVEMKGMKTTVTTELARNEKKRLRAGPSHVRISIDLDHDVSSRLNRCIELFEDFCIVSGSIRAGMDISVEVVDKTGKKIYGSESSP